VAFRWPVLVWAPVVLVAVLVAVRVLPHIARSFRQWRGGPTGATPHPDRREPGDSGDS
jgi:hypothetical protein